MKKDTQKAHEGEEGTKSHEGMQRRGDKLVELPIAPPKLSQVRTSFKFYLLSVCVRI